MAATRRRREDDVVEWLTDLEGERLDDVLYLPPVDRRLESGRRHLAAVHRQRGTPVLFQLRPADRAAPEGCIGVVDLSPLWVGGVRLEEALSPRAHCAVVALARGVGPRSREEADRLCERLAAQGLRVLQGMAVGVEPTVRRRMTESVGDASFLDLFHGETISERELASATAATGMAPFLERPLPRPPLRARNVAVAGALALAAELASRLDACPRQQEAWVRAARWSEHTVHDLSALHRDGNLGVLPWLAPPARELAEELLDDGRSTTMERLLAEYVGGR